MTFSALPGVLDGVGPLAHRFTAAGHRLYLVGGVVRDLWLDRDVSDGDIDLTTDARPDVIRSIVGPVASHVWAQGERFGTIGCEIDGRSYEITTHRAEAYDPQSRKPEVTFGDDIAVDLSRRDFTVNAMAWEVPDGALVDPHGGVADLTAGVLRTPLDPDESFSDDPLRMVRAARFVASLRLRPVDGVVDAMTRLADRLDIVAVERVREELDDKLLAVVDAAVGLELLAETGLLGRIVAELADPERAGRAVARVDALEPHPRLRMAALLAELDADALSERLSAMRCSNHERRVITRLVTTANEMASGPPGDDAAVRRVASTLSGLVGFERAVALAATLGSDRVVGEWSRRHDVLRSAEDPADLAGPLDGNEIAALLGVEPGPVVGEALAYQRRLRTESGPLSPGEARSALLRWWGDRSDPGSP